MIIYSLLNPQQSLSIPALGIIVDVILRPLHLILGSLPSLADQLERIDFLDSRILILLDLPLDLVNFVPHLLNSPLHNYMTLAALIVLLVDSLQLPPERRGIIVVLSTQQSSRIGLTLDLLYFLELPAQTFIDLVVGVVDAVLADRVDLVDAVVHLRVVDCFWLLGVLLEQLSRHRLVLFHIYILSTLFLIYL